MDTNRDIENFKSYSDGLTERIKLNTGEIFTNERELEERVAACEIAIGNLEDDTLKKAQNLNDVDNKRNSLSNLEAAAATPTGPSDYGYDSQTQQSKSNVQVMTVIESPTPMGVPFKDFADTIINTSANPLPINKGGTNAQTEDNAINNLLGDNTTSVLDTAVRDDGVIPYRCDSAYAQGSNVGKVSLLQIFNNWLKSKFQSWLGITVTESGGSITGRSFSGEAATVASITRVTEDVYQIPPQQHQTGVTYTVTFDIPTNKIFIGYRFDISNLAGGTLNIESSYKVTRNQIIVSVKYDFTYGGQYPTITTVAMFCGQ
jgi:hypothetical protein